jgi:amino acid transporter
MKTLSALTIFALTCINCLGIRNGKLVQNTIAVAKIGGLAGLVVLLMIAGRRPIQLSEASEHPALSITGVGVALVAVL